MKILNKFTFKNLRLNKQRSIVTIIGILLSCALITAVMTMYTSFRETMLYSSVVNYGENHTVLYDVSKEDYSIIDKYKGVKNTYYTSKLGYMSYDGEYNIVIGLNSESIIDFSNFIQEGRVPNNDKELVISDYQANKYKLSIGDKITTDIGELYIDTEDGLMEVDHYLYGYEFLFEKDFGTTYEIVGISDNYTYFDHGYNTNMFTYSEEFSEENELFILYDDASQYLDLTIEINDIKYENDMPVSSKYEYHYNSEYLIWLGVYGDDNTTSSLYTVLAIVALIIVGTSVFCIRNSFAISVTEKIRMYGMLSSVGATPKQIKRTVYSEGLYLGLIAIPIGILLGIGVSALLLQLVDLFLGDVSEINFIFSISIWAIIISALLAIITIFFSTFTSARRASKITEIVAIKNQNEIKIKKKKKVPFLFRKLFKVGGIFAYKNMYRNKSKFRTTIISLIVSIATFVSLSYYMNIGFSAASSIYGEANYNISFRLDNGWEIEPSETIEIYNDIIELDNVNRYDYSQLITGFTDLKYLNSEVSDQFSGDSLYMNIALISDLEYTRLLVKNDLRKEDVKDKAIIVNAVVDTSDGKASDILKDDLGEIEISLNGTDTMSFDLLYLDNIDIMSRDGVWYSSPTLVLSREYYSELFEEAFPSTLYVDSTDPYQLHIDVDNYAEANSRAFDIYNIEEMNRIQNNILLLISIFLYGFIAVIILIGLTNVFNTITTNMMLRSREFAILKSIGVSNKELKNMIRLESLLYGLKSLFWGLGIGIGLAYLVFYILNRTPDTALIDSFELPFTAIIISIIFIFLIIYLIMRLSLAKINKQNIIETIKNENI